MKPYREIAILLLVAMGLTLWPAPLNAAYDAIPVSSPDPCEAPACCSEPDQAQDSCCETGCELCSLPCCTGTVMIPTVAQVPDTGLIADGRLIASATAVTWVDTDPLYHPPRD